MKIKRLQFAHEQRAAGGGVCAAAREVIVIFKRGQARRCVAIELAPLDVRGQPARQRNGAVGGDDDPRVAQARELPDRPVDDAHPADPHPRAGRLGLGRAQDHGHHGADGSAERARWNDGRGARNRSHLSRPFNHYAMNPSLPS